MRRQIRNIALLGLLVTASGCDTVAELTFQEEQVIEAIPQGLISRNCGVENPDLADAVFRFSVLTSLNKPLTPGNRYAALADVLTPGSNFKAEDISFSDGLIFVVDDTGADMTCTASEDCPEGAQCVLPGEMGLDQYYYAPVRVCAYATRIDTVSVPRFNHYQKDVTPDNPYTSAQKADGRTFSFVIDNSSTLDGSAGTGIPNADKATDPWQYRKVGLNQFIDSLAASNDARTEFSAIFANGSGESGVYDASPAWLKTPALWDSTVMAQYPSPSGNSPIWEASTAAVKKILDSARPTYTKTMIAMTDGTPNDNDSAWESFKRTLKSVPDMPLHWLELTAGERDPRYAEAVMSSCGTHYIFDNPVFFSKIMRNIAINTESHWDVDVHFSAELPEGHTYRLATTFIAKIGSSAVTFEAHRMNEQTETIDYRLVFSK